MATTGTGRPPAAGAGRPRLITRKRPGDTAREEILDAAAELFTTRGFTSTTTRMIADAVGLRQASLYHHFSNKDDILDSLLGGTVGAPVSVARGLRRHGGPAAQQMYALSWFDVDQLSASRWNLGALYLLPELRTERFAEFRAQRFALMTLYADIAGQTLLELAGSKSDANMLPGTEHLPFRLVETVINTRADGEALRTASTAVSGAPARNGEYPGVVADATVRVLGWSGSTAALGEATPALLRLVGEQAESPI